MTFQSSSALVNHQNKVNDSYPVLCQWRLRNQGKTKHYTEECDSSTDCGCRHGSVTRRQQQSAAGSVAGTSGHGHQPRQSLPARTVQRGKEEDQTRTDEQRSRVPREVHSTHPDSNNCRNSRKKNSRRRSKKKPSKELSKTSRSTRSR